jgi:AcrR family transcriptional regulator
MSSASATTKIVRRRKEARPLEILDAAAIVFAQHGYAATNLERVAALAQVSKGTIYRYFDDKDVLFAKVIEAKLFAPLENPLPLLPASETAGATLRQAFILAYEMGKQSHIADLVRVLILEGERFAAVRKNCLDRLVTLANHSIRSVMDQHGTQANLTTNRFYANPSALFFPIICAIALYAEMKPVADFDMDAFVAVQIDLVCAALDEG